jgi:hypothetical protein
LWRDLLRSNDTTRLWIRHFTISIPTPIAKSSLTVVDSVRSNVRSNLCSLWYLLYFDVEDWCLKNATDVQVTIAKRYKNPGDVSVDYAHLDRQILASYLQPENYSLRLDVSQGEIDNRHQY